MHPILRIAFCSALLWQVVAADKLAAALEPTQVASRPSLSLNGEWTFSIHGRGHKRIEVPATYLPVGGATLERTFDLPAEMRGQCLLLRFDGIVMTCEVFVNDERLGEFGPYTPFTLDITSLARLGENRLRVELSDLGGFEPWGRAWVTAFPRYGGIIRDVTLEARPRVYIANARLDYQLVEDYTRADCRLQTWVVNTSASAERVQLSGMLQGDHERQEFQAEVLAEPGTSRHSLPFTMEHVALWSPESPRVHELSVELQNANHGADRFRALTGFKEFVARGRDFFLNGQKYFLKGVFRHDIYGAQGHTLSREQMEREIADIKSLGCNYLRLGHYPQHAYITELAARHGLLTSGEPPVFGQDQRSRAVVAGARFCLGGLIERDWNNPAVAFWIIANESGTDLGYMREMSEFVRGLDPGRLVTIVDNTKLNPHNVPWEKFREAKLDFICQNAYGAAFDGYYDQLAKLVPDDMPFVISEWGGTVNSYSGVLREGRYYLDHSNVALEQGPRLAGISFWEYQDIPMPRWTEQGLLHWSLVDVDRRPYETYYALKSLYTGESIRPPRARLLVPNRSQQLPRPLAPDAIERIPGLEMLDLGQLVNSDASIGELHAVSPLAWPEQVPLGRVALAGLPFQLDRQVIALTKASPDARIPLDRAVGEILFLGHVCYNSLATKPEAVFPQLPFLFDGFPNHETPVPFKGYPQAGEFGELAAEYVLVYADGERESIPLENGIHLADYRLFFGLSGIDAVATDTERALSYQADYGATTYQLRLFSYRPRRPECKLEAIEFSLKNFDYVPLLAAITVRLFEPD